MCGIEENKSSKLVNISDYHCTFLQLPLFSNIINRGTVNCARLVNFDEKSCGSVLHTVDKLLVPPTMSLLDTVNSNEKYSILAKLIKGTEVEEVLKDEKQSITLLAPPNAIFESINEKELNVLLEDKKKANEVLKHHILTGNSSFIYVFIFYSEKCI